MMNSLRSKHPKKKRRIEGDPEPLPGPSSGLLPLVAPHLVPKSSKDPNRGMYPHAKRKAVYSDLASSPEFVKASSLVSNRHQVKAVVSIGSSSDDEEPPPEQVISDSNKPSTSKSNSVSTRSGKQLLNNYTSNGKRKANIPSRNSATKITRFFMPSDSSQSASNKTDLTNKTQIKRSARLKNHHTVKAFCWSSNWHKKNEQLLDLITHDKQSFKQQDYYGLVKNSEPEEMGEDYFNRLPTHVIENILCQIPMLDLVSCRLVCSRWLDIIDNDKFMEWKKLYYRFRKEGFNHGCRNQLQVQKLTDQFDKDVENCISSIVNFMGKTFNRMPCPEMYNLLVQNHHGELADLVLLERFPEWTAKEQRVWCQFAIAVIVSETVWDILNIYKSLFTSKSCCIRTDVNDALYFIAFLLLYFRSVLKINCGLHYRVHYALYLIENTIPFCQREKVEIPTISGQQSLHNYSMNDNSCLTYEQIRVLNHKFDLNQKIRIIALAGTGKTTTLVHLARLYPQIKFLNIVFNKSVNENAKKKFPPNVTCRTAHALAFSAVGKFLRHKVTSTVRPHDLIGSLSHNEEHIQIYMYAKLVLTTINNFTTSSSTEISLTHVPMMDFTHKTISATNRDRVLMDANKIWQKMIDESDNFKMTHDVYLKLYQLKKPKLNKFQCIMVDEAQDCNPAILDFILSQSMPVLLVGDPNQQIYGFRGAENALKKIKSTHTYYLTKSFRFGPQIAYIASCVLEIMLPVRANNTLIGNTSDSNLCGDTSGQFAIIARTNVMLFNEALRIIVLKRLTPYEPTVIRATFAGGIDSYGFDQISDIYKLKFVSKGKRQLQDKFISRFKSYNDLVNYARYSDDSDLLSKIEIVNQHGSDICNFVAIIKEKCNNSMEMANLVFTTTHKAKGLEFDTVSLTDDYPISTIPGFFDYESSHEEANILYVAITRAKKCLLLPEKITKILHLAHEKFEYPVSSKSLMRDNPELKCVSCNCSFVPHTVLVIVRRKIVLSSGRVITEGPMCMKCGSDPYMRPDVHMNNLVMYLDPTRDNYHRFMSRIAGPLPDDPPILYDSFNEFDNAERVFVINLNIH